MGAPSSTAAGDQPATNGTASAADAPGTGSTAIPSATARLTTT